MIKNKTLKIVILIFTMVIVPYSTKAQNMPFSITIEQIDIPNLGGLQSYAYGQSDGKWLVIGGRLDGLHKRQPRFSFDVAGNNNELIVVDPISQKVWKASLSPLPISIREQLSSTNMEFYQEGEYLYLIGGYGYSTIGNTHITYPNLTAIKVSNVIDAIINRTSFTSFFRQITNNLFEVTGGRLEKINNNYYLLGGQKFTGRYAHMNSNRGPFTQEYTDAIRIFTIQDDGVTITINYIQQYKDSVNLHRRDYNAVPQIMPNGDEGITMFSGVFQYNTDLPFLNSVDVISNGYAVNNNFQQYYNHYHCPVVPLYSVLNNEMHTIFFGGIAQYYDDNGTLIKDDNVPFVNTIARVTRNSNGIMREYKMPTEMPALLGAGAEFIPNMSISYYENKIFKLDSIADGDTVLIGYIYGGIVSFDPNVFFSRPFEVRSLASNKIFKVYLTK